jgi:hypothetical protein
MVDAALQAAHVPHDDITFDGVTRAAGWRCLEGNLGCLRHPHPALHAGRQAQQNPKLIEGHRLRRIAPPRAARAQDTCKLVPGVCSLKRDDFRVLVSFDGWGRRRVLRVVAHVPRRRAMRSEWHIPRSGVEKAHLRIPCLQAVHGRGTRIALAIGTFEQCQRHHARDGGGGRPRRRSPRRSLEQRQSAPARPCRHGAFYEGRTGGNVASPGIRQPGIGALIVRRNASMKAGDALDETQMAGETSVRRGDPLFRLAPIDRNAVGDRRSQVREFCRLNPQRPSPQRGAPTPESPPCVPRPDSPSRARLQSARNSAAIPRGR